MGSFKTMEDTGLVRSKHSGRAIVYLESNDDYQIFFERWFYDEGEYLEFKSSDTGFGGGCSKVIKDVESDRENDIPAFGIVDRDSLLQQLKWDDLWETDDLKFRKSRPFGNYIRPLCRWEIENYLFDIDEITDMLSDFGQEGLKDKSSVIRELSGHCDALIPIMAYNIFLHSIGKEARPLCYCIQHKNRILCEQDVEQKLNPVEKEKYDGIRSKIEAFRHHEDHMTEESFYKLNRIVDGKRLFERLIKHSDLKKTDFRFFLARKIKEKGKINGEIVSLINEFKLLH